MFQPRHVMQRSQLNLEGGNPKIPRREAAAGATCMPATCMPGRGKTSHHTAVGAAAPPPATWQSHEVLWFHDVATPPVVSFSEMIPPHLPMPDEGPVNSQRETASSTVYRRRSSHALTSSLGSRDPDKSRALRGSFFPTRRLKDISRAFAL